MCLIECECALSNVNVPHLMSMCPNAIYPSNVNVPYCHVPIECECALLSCAPLNVHVQSVVACALARQPALVGFFAPLHHKSVIPMHAFNADFSSAK